MALQDDINEQVSQIKSDVAAVVNQEVDHDPIKVALLAVANAIDDLSGDSTALRAAINNIPTTQTIGFAKSKSALNGLVNLLIDQSNFDGSEA